VSLSYLISIMVACYAGALLLPTVYRINKEIDFVYNIMDKLFSFSAIF